MADLKVPAKEPLWTGPFVMIIIINGLLFMGFQFYPSALPPYLKSLGASDSILGILTAMCTIPTLLTRPLAGYLLDKHGRRPVLLTGLFVMAAVSLGMYLFPLIGAILMLRFFHGIFWGLAATGSATTATDFIPKRRMGEGIGYFALSSALAMAVAPALALSLPYEYMFIGGFLFLILSSLVACFMRYKPLSPSQNFKPVFIEKRSLMPSAVITFSNASYGAVVTFAALFALEQGIAHVGFYFTAYAIALMVSRPQVGKLVDRFGCKKVMGPSLVLLALSLLLISHIHDMFSLLLAGACYGVSQGAIMTACQTLSVLRAPADHVGAANATFSSGFDLGLGAGALLFGFISHFTGYSLMFVICAATQILPLLILSLDKQGEHYEEPSS